MTDGDRAAGALAAAPPGVRLFLDHFAIDPSSPAPVLLDSVLRAFSSLPYENLTKVLKLESEGSPASARRGCEEVVRDHIDWGAGGTCFSLTWALRAILRALGWEAEPILADRSYGPDTHCALVVDVGGEPRIVDPGFLITRPVSVPDGRETVIATPFHQVVLEPRAGSDRVALFTVDSGGTRERLEYKMRPADESEFVRAWEGSFGWEMMRYPVLSRIQDGSQLYLQGRRLQRRHGGGVERRDLPATGAGRIAVPDRELAGEIGREFGIDARLVARSLAVLRARGA